MGEPRQGHGDAATVARAWRIELTIADLAAVEPEVHGFLGEAGVEGRAAYVAQLVVEEVVRNLVEHASGGVGAGVGHHADVTIAVAPDRVTVRVDDTRPPFDPREAAPLDVDAPLEARRAGGMGLHLVRELTDDLDYRSTADGNRLTATVARS